jgi:23S rRNA (cytosine1962-C5)-methyltransferase
VKSPAIETVVRINRRAATRLRQGHVWVYRSDLSEQSAASAAAGAEGDGLPPGSLVSVCDERGNLIGTALHSSSSQIVLRMISTGPVAADGLPALVRERLISAIAYRRQLLTEEVHGNACRLAFSEADFLPGLVVDRYNDILAVQILAQAMDQSAVRDAVVETLVEQLKPAGIVERVDARIRELEALPVRESGLLWGEKTETVFTLNDVRFHYDSGSGQKTGAFLDQRENYAAAARHGGGDALDVFSYEGGFALHLARSCRSVTAVDSSRAALESAERNELLNPGFAPVEWMEANAFDLLRDYAASGRQYDIIVLDPPAFTKTKRELPSALRGYKELNLRALKMLRPGGVLVTCSCSYHVGEADFIDMLRAAAADVRRTPRLLEKRGQAVDHPVLLTVPETAYLKCVILQV